MSGCWCSKHHRCTIGKRWQLTFGLLTPFDYALGLGRKTRTECQTRNYEQLRLPCSSQTRSVRFRVAVFLCKSCKRIWYKYQISNKLQPIPQMGRPLSSIALPTRSTFPMSREASAFNQEEQGQRGKRSSASSEAHRGAIWRGSKDLARYVGYPPEDRHQESSPPRLRVGRCAVADMGRFFEEHDAINRCFDEEAATYYECSHEPTWFTVFDVTDTAALQRVLCEVERFVMVIQGLVRLNELFRKCGATDERLRQRRIRGQLRAA